MPSILVKKVWPSSWSVEPAARSLHHWEHLEAGSRPAGILLSLFVQCRTPVLGAGPPTLRMGLPSLSKLPGNALVHTPGLHLLGDSKTSQGDNEGDHSMVLPASFLRPHTLKPFTSLYSLPTADQVSCSQPVCEEFTHVYTQSMNQPGRRSTEMNHGMDTQFSGFLKPLLLRGTEFYPNKTKR